MTTFEEKFPSMKDSLREYEDEIVHGFFLESDIEEHCLDKQRVRNVIDKLFTTQACGFIGDERLVCSYTKDDILRELDL